MEKPLDYSKLENALGGRPSLCVVDSTNMLNENKGMSETLLKEPIAKIIEESKGRVIFTSFASNLGRLKIIAIIFNLPRFDAKDVNITLPLLSSIILAIGSLSKVSDMPLFSLSMFVESTTQREGLPPSAFSSLL